VVKRVGIFKTHYAATGHGAAMKFPD